jgi:hypothetical protein
MLTLPRSQRRPVRARKGQRFENSLSGRGVTMTDENITFIPASVKLRPLRDQLIVQPMDVVHSRILIVPPHSSKLVRGKVLAAGPGHYPNGYMDKWGNKNAPKGQRTQIYAGTVFVPMEVQIGQIVHLDGRGTGKSCFEAFYWGDKYCLHARQADIAGIEE